MTEAGDLDYFAARAEVERMKSEAAIDPVIASVHAQLAESYERMAEGLIKQRHVRSMPENPPPQCDQESHLR